MNCPHDVGGVLDAKAGSKTFYESVFEVTAGPVQKMEHPPWLRHAFLAVGSGTVIHAIEDPQAASMFPGEIGKRRSPPT